MATEFNLKLVIQALDRVTAPARRIARGMSAAMERVSAAAKRAGEALARVAERVGKIGDRISSLGQKLSTSISGALSLLGGFAFRSTAQIETMTVAFESMLGSGEKAEAFVQRLLNFSARTPFQIRGIGGAARQLLAFGFTEDQVMDKLQFLGDIAAGTEIPLETMASILGKVSAKTKLTSEELFQLSDRGANVLQAMADQTGRSKKEILKLVEEGKIGFGTFEKALRSMTTEGGLFFKQMEKQSRTLTGLISTLLDNLNLALAKVGKRLVETFDVREKIARLTAFVQRAGEAFARFAENNPGLTKFLFIMAGVLAVLGPLLIIIGAMASGVSALIAVFGGLFTVVGLLIKGFAILTAVLAANPFILIGIAIAGAIVLGVLLIRNWKAVAAWTGRIWRNIVKFVVNGVRAVTKAIFGVDLVEVGSRWIGGLAEGIAARWLQMVEWISDAVNALIDWMPDWVKERLGLDTGRASPPPLELPQADGSAIVPGQSRVGGRVTVEFQNAPREMRVRKVRSDTPGFEVDTDAGFAMVAP